MAIDDADDIRKDRPLDHDWIQRESNRQYGHYGTGQGARRALPVWEGETWWRSRKYEYQLHFVHVSQEDPTMLAYTPDEQKGMRDIQVRIRPGRYLTRYFEDVLSEERIRHLAEWQTTGRQRTSFDGLPLSIATDPEMIALLYENGPDSCMADWQNRERSPVRIYGAGDLALAYLQKPEARENTALARAIVWPERKLFGRVYPTPDVSRHNWTDKQKLLYRSQAEMEEAHIALRNRLCAEGFQPTTRDNNFNGARLLKLKAGHGRRLFLMPYLDGHYHVKDVGDFFQLDQDGVISGGHTDGVIELPAIGPYGDCVFCDKALYRNDERQIIAEFSSRGVAHQWTYACMACRDKEAWYCRGANAWYVNSVPKVRVKNRRFHYALAYAEHHFRKSALGVWFDPTSEHSALDGAGRYWLLDEIADAGGWFRSSLDRRDYPACERSLEYPQIWKGHSPAQVDRWLSTHDPNALRQPALEGV